MASRPTTTERIEAEAEEATSCDQLRAEIVRLKSANTAMQRRLGSWPRFVSHASPRFVSLSEARAGRAKLQTPFKIRTDPYLAGEVIGDYHKATSLAKRQSEELERLQSSEESAAPRHGGTCAAVGHTRSSRCASGSWPCRWAVIGTFRGCFTKKNGTPRQPQLAPTSRGHIEVPTHRRRLAFHPTRHVASSPKLASTWYTFESHVLSCLCACS